MIITIIANLKSHILSCAPKWLLFINIIDFCYMLLYEREEVIINCWQDEEGGEPYWWIQGPRCHIDVRNFVASTLSTFTIITYPSSKAGRGSAMLFTLPCHTTRTHHSTPHFNVYYVFLEKFKRQHALWFVKANIIYT